MSDEPTVTEGDVTCPHCGRLLTLRLVMAEIRRHSGVDVRAEVGLFKPEPPAPTVE